MNAVAATVSDAVGRELAGEQGPPCLRVKCVDVVRTVCSARRPRVR